MDNIFGWPTFPDNPYGVTKGLFDSSTLLDSQLITDAVALGLSRVRLNHDMLLTEPSSGTFTWTVLDDAVQQCNAAGLRVTLALREFGPKGGGTSWATYTTPCESGGTYYYGTPTNWGNFAVTICQRYSADGNPNNAIASDGSGRALWVDCFELGNEDFDVHGTATGGCRTPLRYVQYARFVVPLMRASVASGGGNWTRRIGTWGCWWQQQTHIAGTVAQQGVFHTLLSPPYDPVYNPHSDPTDVLTLFDYVNCHNYQNPAYGPTVRPYTLDQEASDIRAILNANGHSTMPLWITEFGADGPVGNVAAATQSMYFAANTDGTGNGALSAARDNGVQHVDLYTMDGFGVSNPSNNPTYYGDAKSIAAELQAGGHTRFTAFTTIQNFIRANPTWPFGFVNPGNTNLTKSSLVGTATGFGQLYAQGNAGAWLAHVGAITDVACNPDGNGFLYDTTTLEGMTVVAGTWSAVLTLEKLNSSGNITADLYVRAFKRSSGGVYTLIGTMELAGQSIPGSATTYAFNATSLSSMAFSTGDKLYCDVWANVTANPGATSTTQILLGESSGVAGIAGYMQIATAGYQATGGTPPPVSTPLTVYGIETASSTLSTANQVATATGGTGDQTIKSLLGTATGYNELFSQGDTFGWLAVSDDNFTRANQSGWGTASDGETWVSTGSDTPAIVSNAGVITATSGAHVQLLYLGSNTIQDCEVQAKFQGSVTTHDYAVMARGNGSTTYYMAEMNGGSLEILKVVGGTVTSLATVAETFTANTNYHIKLKCQGVSPTTLSAKFWLDGNTEPAYQVTITDSTASGNLQGAGQYGIRTKLGNTDTATFSSFECDALSAGALGSPSGHGFLLDSTLLEGHTIPAGNWTASLRHKITSGSITADLYVRAYKRSSGGVYTLIGTMSLTGQTITGTVTTYTFAPQAFAAMAFSTGDKLYLDVWADVTANSVGSSTLNMHLAQSSTSNGVAGYTQLVTPGYQ